MPPDAYAGALFIGDPHLASRVPGYRSDDYPRTILKKLKWCLAYAREHRLIPAILGDVFHLPRDNANWLLAELMDVLEGEVLCIYGNHDCAANELSDDDSLQVIIRARRLKRVDTGTPWTGLMGERHVVIGGTSWGQRLPEKWAGAAEPGLTQPPLVFWMAHHNIRFPEFGTAGRFDTAEIPGIALVVNGHIHTPAEPVVNGGTTWINPGNIARITFSDRTKERAPSVLRVDVDERGWRWESVVVPHEPFADVFCANAAGSPGAESEGSLFVSGLSELRALRTGGAGLTVFLKQNIGRYPEPVQAEIMALAREVVPDGKIEE